MKKLLNFLKRKWFLFVLIFLGVFLSCLTPISPYFLMAACVVFSSICFYFARILQNNYNKILAEDPEDDFFDATVLDYDEEVYYIGSSAPKKQIKKGFISQISAKTPSIALYILAVALLTLPLFTLLKAFIF